MRFSLLFSAAFAALSIVSCGPDGMKLYPVEGKVLFDGVAPEGATIIFQPTAGGTMVPSGLVTADGGFKLKTHPHGEGAPPGEYAVLITWHPANARETGTAKNKLPAKYGDATKTTVPKVTVAAGPNQVPEIKLTSK